MVANEDPPRTSMGDTPVLAGRTKWAAGVGAAVVVVALVGLGIRSFLEGAGMVPVIAIAIAVLGGAAIALWLIEEHE